MVRKKTKGTSIKNSVRSFGKEHTLKPFSFKAKPYAVKAARTVYVIPFLLSWIFLKKRGNNTRD